MRKSIVSCVLCDIIYRVTSINLIKIVLYFICETFFNFVAINLRFIKPISEHIVFETNFSNRIKCETDNFEIL